MNTKISHLDYPRETVCYIIALGACEQQGLAPQVSSVLPLEVMAYPHDYGLHFLVEMVERQRLGKGTAKLIRVWRRANVWFQAIMCTSSDGDFFDEGDNGDYEDLFNATEVEGFSGPEYKHLVDSICQSKSTPQAQRT